MSKLILNNIFKKYDVTSDYAVNNFNFEGKQGEFISILGPSGCGKTTTLRMIAGLETISSGTISIEDKIINNTHPKDRGIGLAFEDYALYPPLNVYDNIAYNLRAKGINSSEIKKQVMEISELMHVSEILDKFPKELSGGQKQRVNIARAIVRKPSILLLDEPMSHLDGKLRQTLRQELRKLHLEIGCTTILVTHDQLEAMSLADTLIIMNLGVIQQIGSPFEVYNKPQNEFVAGFIGDPPMNLVDGEIKKKENDYIFSFYGIEIPLPQKYAKNYSSNNKIRLGVRPDDVVISNSGTPVQISVFENLGQEKRISIRLMEDLYFMITTTENVSYSKNDMVKIKFKEDKLHLFNKE